MAVDRNHVPDIINLDSAGRLCRELQLAGIEPLLTTTSDGCRTTGVALIIDAGAVQKSEAAAAQFRRQAFDALVQGLPLSVAISCARFCTRWWRMPELHLRLLSC